MEIHENFIGLFYSTENNLIYEKLKYTKDLSEEKKEKVKMLPFKFLGPVFLTAASEEEKHWRIELIESALSLYQGKIMERNVIQSFFNLNSSFDTPDGVTNLYALIGSPYTEDIEIIYDKMKKYIHPSIIQGKIVEESILADDFKFKEFINEELNCGINLIEHSMGSSRKIYWKEQKKYFCIGLIERTKTSDSSQSFLYTFERTSDIRKRILNLIPSFYVMAILPDFYEKLIEETLRLFDITNVFPNIRQITLSNKNNEVVYIEEFLKSTDVKRSYGLILIPFENEFENLRNLNYFRKQLRQILDRNKNINKILNKLNYRFDIIRWGANTEEELNEIKNKLDRS